ncbi:MAG: diguanylate cyclase [Planctomycetota bacterium]
MFFEQFEELKSSGKLPTPSGVGLRILMLTRSEECSLDEVSRTMQADPALTGRVLKLANSAISGGVKAATEVREAAVRLGLRTVCNVALGFSLIAGNKTGRCPAFDYDGYWAWSIANALAAQRLCRELRQGLPGEAFTLGLLARVGRLALASVHPAEYATLLESLRADPHLDLLLAERDTFCINHRQVGAAIAEDWGLPPVFSEVALYVEGRVPETLDWPETRIYLRVLRVSARLADVMTGKGDSAAHWPAAREELRELGFDLERVQPFYDSLADEWKDWCKLLEVPANLAVGSAELVKSTASPRATEDALRAANGLRILLVDDDPTSLRIVRALLERSGHAVETARNGHEALARALESPPQMVVTDWMMPEMDGVELCKRLRSTEAGRDLYILILTGQNEEQRIVEAFEAGADDHLAKPVNSKLLLARIRPGIRVIQLQERLQGEVNDKKDAYARLAIATRKFEVASMTDALTGLANRRYAMRRLEKEWASSERSGLPLSLILLDIDHFKSVNDNHGHDVGDQVLRETSRAVHHALRTSDTCTRMGGEEFLVICPGTPLEGATQLAERIRASVEANLIEVPGFTRGHVTISLGVASNEQGGLDSVEAVLKASDEAVYDAKRAGRNRVAVASKVVKKKSA